MTTGELSHRLLSARAGVGLRSPHIAEVMRTHPAVPWFEVHAENYMTGGSALRALEEIRLIYPISLHGVGLSLGGAAGVARGHLGRVPSRRALRERRRRRDRPHR